MFDEPVTEPDLRAGDAFDLIRDVDDGSVQLTMTSPPYNVGKAYEQRVDLDKYLEAYNAFARLLYAKTTESGSVCWQVGNFVHRGEIFPLDVYFYRIFKAAGFQLRNRIIWHFGHGLHATRRLSGRYETILWFSKTDDYAFNLDPVRVPSKYPGKLGFKGDRKGQPTGNPLGKNPADVWEVVAADWEREIWDVPNVKAKHTEKTVHPCQYPVELVQRCVLALSSPGDLVLDPFLGVGSTAIGALMHGRRFMGFELDPSYMTEAKMRIAAYRSGQLKIRQLGQPVATPSGKVAAIPGQWLESISDSGTSGNGAKLPQPPES